MIDWDTLWKAEREIQPKLTVKDILLQLTLSYYFLLMDPVHGSSHSLPQVAAFSSHCNMFCLMKCVTGTFPGHSQHSYLLSLQQMILYYARVNMRVPGSSGCQ